MEIPAFFLAVAAYLVVTFPVAAVLALIGVALAAGFITALIRMGRL